MTSVQEMRAFQTV